VNRTTLIRHSFYFQCFLRFFNCTRGSFGVQVLVRLAINKGIHMSVFDLSIGESAQISGFENQKTATTSESMGLYEGQSVQIAHKSGDIVINVNFRTIAISKALAKKIHVSV
jgi:Fe2+ transport system protein FeoA